MSSASNRKPGSPPSAAKRGARSAVPRTAPSPSEPSKALPSLSPPTSAASQELKEQLRELRLPMFREHFQSLGDQAARESLSHPQYLAELTRLECQTRRQRRIQRLLEQSRLPREKTWENFDWKRIPLAVARQAESLRDGTFLDRRENLLVFGKPGSGKTHCVCALAERLVQQGRAMLFTTCGLLVQSLLAAKRDLRLQRAIKQLSRFEGLILDDLG
jgi:DNA replication protein DnaC